MKKSLRKKLYENKKESLTRAISEIKEAYPFVNMSEKYQNLSNDVLMYRNTIQKISENSNINDDQNLKNLFDSLLSYLDEIVDDHELEYEEKCKYCDSDIDSIVRDITFENDVYFDKDELDEIAEEYGEEDDDIKEESTDDFFKNYSYNKTRFDKMQDSLLNYRHTYENSDLFDESDIYNVEDEEY